MKTTTLASAPGLPADPIFAAIEAARRARAAYDKERKPLLAMWRKHPELRVCFIFVAKVGGDSEKVSTLEHLNAWLHRQGPAHRVYGKRVFAEAAARVLGIPEPAVADPSPEALAAWEVERAAAVAEFECAKQSYDQARETAGAKVSHDAIEKAGDVSEAADEKVLATVPTSPAGGVALARFCVELMERFGEAAEFTPVLRTALATLIAMESGQ